MKIACRDSIEVFLTTAFYLGAGLLFLLALYAVLEPLWPIFTAGFYVVIFYFGFKRWWTATLSVTGFAVYVSSWYVTTSHGEIIGMAVCGIGLLVWMLSGFKGICHTLKTTY